VLAVVRGWAEVSGPFTATALAAATGLAPGAVDIAVAALEGEGLLLRGAFTPGGTPAAKNADAATGGAAPTPETLEWCDRRILARIHRATVAALRREIEPVPPLVFLRFLASWQHAAPGTRMRGADGLLQVIEILQGFEAPVEAWEGSILPARVERYDPDDLERLCLGGQVAWARAARRGAEAGAPGGDVRRGAGRGAAVRRPARARSAGAFHRGSLITLALRDDLPWLLPRATRPALSSRAAAVAEHLEARGASFPTEIGAALRLLPAELDAAIGELVATGVATLDGVAALRRIAGIVRRRNGRAARAGGARAHARFVRHRGAARLGGEGRVTLLDRARAEPEDAPEQRAGQLLRRWGVLFRDLLEREPAAPAWRELLPVLRRAEARGEVRGGRFVDGFTGEQFALAEAVDALRAERRAEPRTERHEIAPGDPLNLAGILTPGPRVPSAGRARVLFAGGAPAGAALQP
jgi:ATP-dependent Lhr-like helicase